MIELKNFELTPLKFYSIQYRIMILNKTRSIQQLGTQNLFNNNKVLKFVEDFKVFNNGQMKIIRNFEIIERKRAIEKGKTNFIGYLKEKEKENKINQDNQDNQESQESQKSEHSPGKTYLRPHEIEILPGGNETVLQQTEQVILKTKNPNHRIYQKDGEIVEIIKNNDQISIRPLLPHDIVRIFSSDNCNFLNFRKNIKGKYTDFPIDLAQKYLTASKLWKVPVLKGIISHPMLRKNGTLLNKTGYDKDSQLYLHKSLKTIWYIPAENPILVDAKQAIQELKYLIGEFPFVSNADRSVWIAQLLTSLSRKNLNTAPMFLYSATKAGTGKTLLCDLITAITEGQEIKKTGQSKTDKEERKEITSFFRAGTQNLCIDNVEKKLETGVLNAILTSRTFSTRILGESKIFEMLTQCTLCCTGNNLKIEGDLTRRCIRCDLDANCEHPDQRSFKTRDIMKQTSKDRSIYINAGNTILQAYINAGTPVQDIPDYGSFYDWSDSVRSAIIWTGESDPCLTRKKIQEDDPIKQNLKNLLEVWYNEFQNKSQLLSKIIKGSYPELEEVFIEIFGEKYSSNSISRYLKKYLGRIEGGKKFMKGKKINKKLTYKITVI